MVAHIGLRFQSVRSDFAKLKSNLQKSTETDIMVMYFRGERRQDMNYNKLWKVLIDRKLKKKDLREMAGLSTNVMAKMGKDGDVSTQVLRKISEALNVKVEDIVDFED